MARSLSLFPASVDAMEEWLDRHGDALGKSQRLVRTACKKVFSALREHVARGYGSWSVVGDIDWLLANENFLFGLLANEELSPPTIASYLSRFRRAALLFKSGGELEPPRKEHKSAVALAPSPLQQVAEAGQALARWPDLIPYLREPLARAAQDFLRALGVPSNPDSEDSDVKK